MSRMFVPHFRWEIGEIEKLPEYMKICYVALYNTINDVGYKVLKEYGWFIIPHLRKTVPFH